MSLSIRSTENCFYSQSSSEVEYKTDAIHYHAKIGPQYKGRAIKRLVVCNVWSIELAKRSGPGLISPDP